MAYRAPKRMKLSETAKAVFDDEAAEAGSYEYESGEVDTDDGGFRTDSSE